MGEQLAGFDAQKTYDRAAQDYDDAMADYWLYVSMRSVERLDLEPGERVLDVPCGTGRWLVAAARAVGPDGRATGIDYAPGMVAIAERRAAESGLDNIEVERGDMLAIAPPAVPFDAVVCALGVFFVDDMSGLVRSLLALARPGTGRLVVSVFGEEFYEPLRTVFVEAVADVAPHIDVAQPWRRTEGEATLRELFEGPDVDELRIVTDTDRLPLLHPSDWWRIVIGSGLRHTVRALGEEAAAEVQARCDTYIASRGITQLLTTTRYATARRRAA